MSEEKSVSSDRVRARVMETLSRHVGREKAIGMGELYERVYGKPWKHRINDTRELRKVITEMRFDGVLIAEDRSNTGAGYYLGRSEHEVTSFLDRRTQEALKKLKMVAAMKRKTLPEFMGQLSLSLSSDAEAKS